MADGVLGLGSSGSTGLSQDVIDKLKAAERKAKVEPIEKRLEDWDAEVDQFGTIESKVTELFNASKEFDLFKSGANAFEKVIASTSGTSVVFDATDTSNLKPGSISVNVSQLAQKDVYQSALITDKTATLGAGTITIGVGGSSYDFSTDGKTYDQLIIEMNGHPELDVALEQVSDSEYRMIIKSSDSGMANALSISQTGIDLGLNDSFTSESAFTPGDTVAGSITINGITFTNDGVSSGQTTYQDLADQINAEGTFSASFDANGKLTIASADGMTSMSVTDDTMNLGLVSNSQTLKAQNFQATIDGISYDTSLSTITLQGGLTVTGVELGTSTISLQRDTSNIQTSLEDLITKYNELSDLIYDGTTNADSKLEDKSALRSMLSGIKDIIFGTDYGTDNDKSLFNYGLNLDKTGHLSLDSAVFGDAVTNDLDNLKALFIGVAEDKGLGTKLKEYLDDLDSFDGLLTSYGDSMSKEVNLEEEKLKAITALDSKYSQLAAQFASYTAIISKFEASFSGLKQMIAETNAGN